MQPKPYISNHRSPSISPTSTFHARAMHNWKIVQEEEQALEKIRQLFASENDIWPDQCKYACTNLRKIETPLKELYELFDDPSNLPPHIFAHRYTPLLLLQQATIQVQTLTSLINNFRRLCYQRPKSLIKYQKEIKTHLDTLMNVYQEAFQQVQIISDQARFLLHP